MQTIYLIVLTLIGGLFTLFAAAGWGSYSEKKLPATPMLFRWFITGLLGSGLGSYAWLYGANGDPTKLIEQISESLEVKQVMEGLTQAAGTVASAAASAANAAPAAAATAVETVVDTANDITVGMPTF
jgi:hypothetical protein